MKEITLKAYSAHELEGKARMAVLMQFHDINVKEERWAHPLVEKFRQRLESYGITADICYSGFWHEGSGAYFTSTVVDTDLLFRKLRENGLPIQMNEGLPLQVQFFASNAYSHKETANVARVTMGDGCLTDFNVWDLESWITTWAQAESTQFYQTLENKFKELTSEDAVLNALGENGVLFTASGKVIPQA